MSALVEQQETIGSRIAAARNTAGRTVDDLASAVGVGADEYREMEAGRSELEHWAPLLGAIAVATGRPTSRFLASTGKAKDVVHGRCGPIIKTIREELHIPTSKILEATGITADEYNNIEKGTSGLEVWCPRLLSIANTLEQPIFNFIINIPMKPLAP
eukprot:TRINITY_DN35689_c0_g1_i1.p1 TRINITY_DN35689_c0_g1~~TRINITY_DN35689_c0_g1_i1.p1  ORF type:complete len:169 (+),score=70.82 TRINITY_DN35689_c0_g1_i1:34-507(+)